MSISKVGTILALVLTFGGTAPALAHNNLNDWMAMMQRIRQQQSVTQQTVPGDPTGAFAKVPEAPKAVRGPKRSMTPGTKP